MKKVAFTSITVNYAPKARVLAQSFKRHHPDVDFYLLLADDPPADLDLAHESIDRIFTFKDLEIPDFQGWVFKHSVVEICTAIKGFFLKQMLDDPECSSVLYLDPDIAVFAPLDSVYSALETSSIVLTPHLLEAESEHHAIQDNELSALKHGVYNLGFLGVKNSPEGRKFAQWWKDRLEHYCYADIPNGMFTDQRWIDLAPGFFGDLHILRDEGCNVAPWNLSRRKVAGSLDAGLTVNGKPLKFYHFSGFDSGAQMTMLQRYAQDAPVLFEMHQWYIDQCALQDGPGFSRTPWSYDFFENETRIPQAARMVYRTREDLQRAFPDPYAAPVASGGFQAWWQEHGGHSVPRSAEALQTELREVYSSKGWKLVSMIRQAKRLISP